MSNLSLKKKLEYFKKCQFNIYNPYKKTSTDEVIPLIKANVVHTNISFDNVVYGSSNVIYIGQY